MSEEEIILKGGKGKDCKENNTLGWKGVLKKKGIVDDEKLRRLCVCGSCMYLCTCMCK